MALLAAVGFAAAGISGRLWAFIPAVVIAVFALADVLLAIRGSQAADADDLRKLLAGRASRTDEVRAKEYGVDAAVLPAGQDWSYVRRDFEPTLRAAIRAALAGAGPPLVMLAGDTKSGKTCAAFHALSWPELNRGWVIVPRDGGCVEALLRAGTLPEHWTPLIVWLDDLERYVSVDASGLNAGTLRNLRCDRPVVLLGTVGGRGSRGRPEGMIEPVAQLRELTACIEVPVRVTEEERTRVEEAYAPGVASEIDRLGLGRRMVAMAELRERLGGSRVQCREGIAVIRAAIEWRRTGAQRPLSTDELERLYKCYLPDDLDPCEEVFNTGLRWAREPLPNTEIALLRRAADDAKRYEPYDLAVELASREWLAADERAQTQMVALATPQDYFQMATTAFDAGETGRALKMLARAERSQDRQLAATSAFNVGVLLMSADDLSAAEDAYRRADKLGSTRGAFNLGQLLRKRGDLTGAEQAYHRADRRGSPEGTVNFGYLLEQRGELAQAEDAYRRARDRGSRKGAANLARLRAIDPDQYSADSSPARGGTHGSERQEVANAPAMPISTTSDGRDSQ